MKNILFILMCTLAIMTGCKKEDGATFPLAIKIKCNFNNGSAQVIKLTGSQALVVVSDKYIESDSSLSINLDDIKYGEFYKIYITPGFKPNDYSELTGSLSWKYLDKTLNQVLIFDSINKRSENHLKVD